MCATRTTAWIVACALIAATTGVEAAAADIQQAADVYRVEELFLRSRVISAALPVIPGSFQPRTPAVAVAEVELSSKGKLLGIEILEAPTAQVARAIQAALRSWTFRSVGEGSGHYVGKLTFYIVAEDGAARVLSPGEMFSRQSK